VPAVLLLLGLVLLVVGGEVLVRGASSLARTIGISPLVVGLTVVAFATSAPELAVTLEAVANDSPELAIGNVVGSNIANILLVLGGAALIAPLAVRSRVVKQDIPVMIGFSVLLFVFAYDLTITRTESAILLALLGVYLVRAIITSRRENAAGRTVPIQGEPLWGDQPGPEPDHPAQPGSFAAEASGDHLPTDLKPVEPPTEERPMRPWLAVLLVAGGVVLLVLGAQFLVTAAQDIARSLGISELVIGLTVVALGTSLPELTTAIVAALRGERDLAVGNAVGSNIFNIGAVIGISGLAVDGLPVPQSTVSFDLILVILTGVLLLPMAFTAFRLSRLEGGLLVACYVLYTTYLLLDSTGHDRLDSFTSAVMWVAAPGLALILVVSVALDLARRRREREQRAVDA
jgi:cation:H+ antiporter